MLEQIVRYKAADRVRDIIKDNNRLLFVLNRFKIPFGFGNSTIEEVCADNHLDSGTFLAVVNLISHSRADYRSVDLPTLMAYLKETHSYILDFVLPGIRDSLVKGVHQPHLNDVALFLIKFFDEYMDEVRNHTTFEDDFVFGYIAQLQNGIQDPDFRIRDFAAKHNSMVSKLNELKDIFLQHYALPNTRMLNRFLFDITACGEDLVSHCEIENRLLVPAVEKLERDVRQNKPDNSKTIRIDTVARNARFEALSDREKEILCLVAHGLSNKEIADKLCLSFHTITTYRKNLSAKLNIHSTAALTIFAILHHIIDPKEIDLEK